MAYQMLRIGNPRAIAGLAAAGTAAAVRATNNNNVTFLSEDSVPAASYPWPQDGFFSGFDHAALRRGFQVYREVCSTCHSLEELAWRNMIGVTHTKEEIKDMAKEVEIEDGPNLQGEMYYRPSKHYDYLPGPYPNKQAGAAANNGAYPPDLSLMAKAREGGPNYIMSLMTGYTMEKPYGKLMMSTLAYNPYFPGGGIAMPPPLVDEGVEYEDGTPATVAQQARDVAQFLAFVATPELEERKKYGTLYFFTILLIALGSGYRKRLQWSSLKSRRITYVKPDSAFDLKNLKKK